LLTDGWTRLKAPENLARALLSSVPLMLLNVAIMAGVLWLAVPEPLNRVIRSFLSPFGGSFSVVIGLPDLVTGALALILLMLAHELLHLAFFPGLLHSEKTYLGITYAGVYVNTEEELTRKRFFIISIAPFIVLSVLLPLVLGFTGLLYSWLVFMALLNALGSSMDLMGLLLLIRQVPPGARIRNAGMDTYWKACPASRAAAA
jgi:hypothetical protein